MSSLKNIYWIRTKLFTSYKWKAGVFTVQHQISYGLCKPAANGLERR